MSMIRVDNLTFSYDSAPQNIFEDVSFCIDSRWKLGFIGRNGRGKTTLLRLLMGQYPYSGTITHRVAFDYFPFDVADDSLCAAQVVSGMIAPFSFWETQMQALIAKGTPQALEEYGDILEQYTAHDGYIIQELIEREAGKLGVCAEVLQRPFCTLSNGERTKLMLAGLFLKKNNFLLIDEPTNHLDAEGRRLVSLYLSGKSGFILVSHDRFFLDSVIDHVLSINRNSIEVLQGNFSTWQENKNRKDQFELAENRRLKKDIVRLNNAFQQKAHWSDLVEKSKIGTHSADRGAVGHKAAKMMKRAKSIEQRQEASIAEKSKLLKDIEKADSLKLSLLPYPKEVLAEARELSIGYAQPLFFPLSFQICRGDRVALVGKNGCGKTSLLRLLMGQDVPHSGSFTTGSNLLTSYVPQNFSFLKGNLRDFAAQNRLDESLFKAILRKLDFARTQFDKEMESFSGGQKKKVLIAKSLCQPAHLLVWDEPLNFIDVLSRIQIEDLLLTFCPTMIFVEHDSTFCSNVATKRVLLE